jgi:hypothetical protein
MPFNLASTAAGTIYSRPCAAPPAHLSSDQLDLRVLTDVLDCLITQGVVQGNTHAVHAVHCLGGGGRQARNMVACVMQTNAIACFTAGQLMAAARGLVSCEWHIFSVTV